MNVKHKFVRVLLDLEEIREAIRPNGHALTAEAAHGIAGDAAKVDRLADEIMAIARSSGTSMGASAQTEALPTGSIRVGTMTIEPAKHMKGSYTVLVDRDGLVVASGKRLPYSTWIGTITPRKDGTAKIKVMMPAASVPRGYKAAAHEMLVEAAKHLKGAGVAESLPHGGTSGHRTWTLAGEAKDVQKAIALLASGEGESRSQTGKLLSRVSVTVDKLEQDGEVATVTVRAWVKEEGVDGPVALSEQFNELRHEAPPGQKPISSLVYVDDVTESLPRPRGTCGKTPKERRQAEHIAESYESRGVEPRLAKSGACATVNARRNERMAARR